MLCLLLSLGYDITFECYLATSAIDLDTDKAVQDILRGPQFKNTTILTIAYVSAILRPLALNVHPVPSHRLNTIIESDRVLVMSDGKVQLQQRTMLGLVTNVFL